jgi:hypothetical protein
MYDLQIYEVPGLPVPFESFVNALTPTQRRALDAANRVVLAALGKDVCGTEFGKALGRGLYELRLRQNADDILARYGRPRVRIGAKEPGRILLREYFYDYGSNKILILSGYDKGKHTSAAYEQKQIAKARKYLAEFRRRP